MQRKTELRSIATAPWFGELCTITATTPNLQNFQAAIGKGIPSAFAQGTALLLKIIPQNTEFGFKNLPEQFIQGTKVVLDVGPD